MNIKSTVFLGIGKFFEKIIAFLFYFIIARYFGSDHFGDFVFQYSVASFIMVIFDFGGEIFCVRFFTNQSRNEDQSNLIAMKSVVALVIICVVILIGWHSYLVVLLLLFYMDAIISVLRSRLFAIKDFGIETIFSVGEKCLSFLFFFLSILTFKDIKISILAMVLGKFLGLIIYNFYRPFVKQLVLTLINFKVVFQEIKTVLKDSWSYSLHGLTYLLFYQIDLSLLKYYHISDGAIGEYAAAMKIFGFGLIVSEVLFRQYYPEINNLMKKGMSSQLVDFVAKLTRANFAISFVLLTVILSFSVLIIEVTFGAGFNQSSRILSILAFAFLFRFQSAPYSGIISASEHNLRKVFVSLICVMFNVLFNFLFIPRFGILASAVITVLTEFLFWVLLRITLVRTFNMGLESLNVFHYLLILSLMGLTFFSLHLYNPVRIALFLGGCFFVLINRKWILDLYH